MPKYVTRREARIHREYVAEALKLQAQKYEARLVALNGEHKTNIENWSRSVQKEVYEENKRVVEQTLAHLRDSESIRLGQQMVWRLLAGSGGLGLILSIAQFLGWGR